MTEPRSHSDPQPLRDDSSLSILADSAAVGDVAPSSRLYPAFPFELMQPILSKESQTQDPQTPNYRCPECQDPVRLLHRGHTICQGNHTLRLFGNALFVWDTDMDEARPQPVTDQQLTHDQRLVLIGRQRGTRAVAAYMRTRRTEQANSQAVRPEGYRPKDDRYPVQNPAIHPSNRKLMKDIINMTTNGTRREKTDRAITEARGHITRYADQLSNIAGAPLQELIVVDITTETIRQVLFTALEHDPVTITGHRHADCLLRQATSRAALQARDAIYPAAHSNISGLNLQNPTGQEPDDWMRLNAHALQATGHAVRDVFRAMLMACTAPLTHDENSKTARQQAVDLAAHVSTVMDTATNFDAIRERMPTLPTPPAH